MTGDVVADTRVMALRVRNLRNLRRLDLEIGADASRILVTGPNGAGKTTILEALYLLARGRSFRGRKAGALTTDGEGRLLVEASLHEGDGADPAVLVFERSSRGLERRLNGLAFGNRPPREMPLRVKLVGENPQALLDGEPTLRRALLDWNLFHVEQQLGRLRMDLRRVLAQRNAALRQNGFGVSLWDLPLVELADRITRQRIAFVRSWSAHFVPLADNFTFLRDCDLSFDRGWPKDVDLIDALGEGRATELMRGQTLAGPHRADVALMR
jgi:DNA replication and repair protein RecF